MSMSNARNMINRCKDCGHTWRGAETRFVKISFKECPKCKSKNISKSNPMVRKC